MIGRILMITFLAMFSSGATQACMDWELRVNKKLLEMCYKGFSEKVQNLPLIQFLKENKSNPRLSRIVKTMVDMSITEFIDYLQNGVSHGKEMIRLEADTLEEVRALNDFVNYYNTFIKGVHASANSEIRPQVERVVIESFSGLATMAEKNQNEFDDLKGHCPSSKHESEKVKALEVVFSDGSNKIVPTSFKRLSDQKMRLAYVEVNGLQKQVTAREIYFKDGKFYWVAKDGQEWLVKLNQISYQKAVDNKPPQDQSDICYLYGVQQSHFLKRREGSQPAQIAE